MADLGRAALVVSFGLSLYALIAGTSAAITKRRRLADSARYALITCFATTFIASVVLASALIRHDFTFTYVAAHTSRNLSTIYSLTAFWGGQEGSLLLWLLVLTGYGAVAVTLNRKLLSDLVVWVVPVLGGLATFFAFMLTAVSSPFDTQRRIVDGAGLVPSLQNPYMVAHPPMLYLGYVGLSIPFAFAAGAMLSGHTDERWIVATRRWTLVAWMCLGFGQILGSKWAYEEVGWGGYFAWDPVENAALMPWLAATAFLHSVMVQERKGMLRVWNMVLVAMAFGLSVFGTFLTRSGVVNSIHSFAKSSIGGWFLFFVVITTVFSTSLILWRLPILRARTKLESALSREATFLYNNLLLVAFCLTIFWGEIFPILTQLFEGEQKTIGRPYYDFFLRIFGLPLLLLMGVGPLIAWRRTSSRALLKSLRWPIGVALVAGIVLVALGAGSSRPGLIAYTFSAFVVTTMVVELVRGTRVTGSLVELIGRNRRRYGGYIVHASIVLLALGIAGSSAYQTDRYVDLSPGQSVSVDGYHMTYNTLTQHKVVSETDTVNQVRAHVTVTGRQNKTLSTGIDESSQLGPSSRVAISTDWLRGEDFFVRVDQRLGGQQIRFQVFVKPLVNLIWIGGVIFVLGSLVAMWPDAREQRRLVSRLALARA